MLVEEDRDEPVLRGVLDYETFYLSEYRAVLGLAYVLTNSRAIAEDLTQDAFADAFRRWSEVGSMAFPGAWVRRVVANRSASRFRRISVERRALQLLGTEDGPREDPRLSGTAVALWSEVRRLPRRQMEVVVLVYYAGLSHSETADLLGCTVDTVRTHLKRAKEKLAKRLGETRWT